MGGGGGEVWRRRYPYLENGFSAAHGQHKSQQNSTPTIEDYEPQRSPYSFFNGFQQWVRYCATTVDAIWTLPSPLNE